MFGCFTYLRCSFFPFFKRATSFFEPLNPHSNLFESETVLFSEKNACTEYLRCTSVHYIRATKMGSTAVDKNDYICSSTYPYQSTDSNPSQHLSPFCRTLDLTEINVCTTTWFLWLLVNHRYKISYNNLYFIIHFVSSILSLTIHDYFYFLKFP